MDIIPDSETRNAHINVRENLIGFVGEKTGMGMDASTFTMVFTRRSIGYKRATLVVTNLESLRRINKMGKMRIVFAGKRFC